MEANEESQGNLPMRNMTAILWKPPDIPTIKINVNATVRGNPGPARIRCELRDHIGHWLEGEARNIDDTTQVKAELLTILHGLKLAWGRGCNQVILESDSANAIDLITGKRESRRHMRNLIQSCKDMLARDWLVKVVQTCRVANHVVDWIAKWAIDQVLRSYSLISLTQQLCQILEKETDGRSRNQTLI